MISQMTPAGARPEIRARSTEASVCPERTSTPPSRATKGNMCPGTTRSSQVVAGSTRTWTVRDRSAAEMPVVVPVLASTDTVNAVCKGAVLWRVIMGNWSAFTRSSVRAQQISPRPCVAMKAIDPGVVASAAITRSPSFSLSSSSQTMHIRPSRKAEMEASTGSKSDSRLEVMGVKSTPPVGHH